MNFVASIRLLLGKINLGPNVIMEKLITENLLEPARILATSTDADQDEILDNIEKFEHLIKSEWFDKKSMDAAEESLRTHPELARDLSPEHLVSEITEKLIDGGWKTFEKHFDPNNMSAAEFMSYFAAVVNNKIRDVAGTSATYRKHFKNEKKERNKDDDVLPVDAIFSRNPQALPEIEQRETAEKLQEGLLKYVAMKDPDGKNGIYYAFMLVWLDKTLGAEVDRVEMKKIFNSAVIQHMAEAEGLSERNLEEAFSQLKRWVVEYIQKVRKIRVTDRFKQYHKISSDNDAMAMCRMAYMILGFDEEFVSPDEELATIRAEMARINNGK